MTEVTNLDLLTDKVYREGIEKAQKESREIRANAEAERSRILDEANKEASKVIAEAKQEAVRIARTTEGELRLKGKQLISDLKVQIHKTLAQKVLENPTKEAFEDEVFIKSAILEAIRTWQVSSDLEVVLPKVLENKLENAFHQNLRKHVKNLNLTFDQRMTVGFRVTEREQGYQISFSDEDFIALFTPYLQEQTQQLLFNSST